MKYYNTQKVLPEGLIEIIKEYVYSEKIFWRSVSIKLWEKSMHIMQVNINDNLFFCHIYAKMMKVRDVSCHWKNYYDCNCC